MDIPLYGDSLGANLGLTSIRQKNRGICNSPSLVKLERYITYFQGTAILHSRIPSQVLGKYNFQR